MGGQRPLHRLLLPLEDSLVVVRLQISLLLVLRALHLELLLLLRELVEVGCSGGQQRLRVHPQLGRSQGGYSEVGPRVVLVVADCLGPVQRRQIQELLHRLVGNKTRLQALVGFSQDNKLARPPSPKADCSVAELP